MYSEKILVSKMMAYLKDIIFKYNTSSYLDFLNYSKSLIKQKDHNQDILKILYFEKFYPILQKNEVISFKKEKNLNPNFISEIDIEILNNSVQNKLSQNKNIYIHLKNFGNYRKSILNKIFQKYEFLDDQSFLMISKVYLLNDYQERSWETKCIERIQEIILPKFRSGQKIDSLTLKLLEHLGKINLSNLNSNQDRNNDLNENSTNINKLDSLIKEIKASITTQFEEIESTKTQKSLELHLNQMKLNYKIEYFKDYYVYDYYLPNENIVIEYDGPDHFYPLQTQLTENSKFKYKNISEKFKSKVVIIPHFEYSRYDSPELSSFFLKNLLFNNYDIFNTPLFHENFNYFIPLRNIKE